MVRPLRASFLGSRVLYCDHRLSALKIALAAPWRAHAKVAKANIIINPQNVRHCIRQILQPPGDTFGFRFRCPGRCIREMRPFFGAMKRAYFARSKKYRPVAFVLFATKCPQKYWYVIVGNMLSTLKWEHRNRPS